MASSGLRERNSLAGSVWRRPWGTGERMGRGFRKGTALTTDIVLIIPRKFRRKTKSAALTISCLISCQSLFKQRDETCLAVRDPRVTVQRELAQTEQSGALPVFIPFVILKWAVWINPLLPVSKLNHKHIYRRDNRLASIRPTDLDLLSSYTKLVFACCKVRFKFHKVTRLGWNKQ